MKYTPNLQAVLDLLSPKFTEALKHADRQLDAKGVAHVIVGGLAVGAYGTPRNTKDIDFLVDMETAFETHGPIINLRDGMPFSYAGLPIDLLPAEERFLVEALTAPEIDETGWSVIGVLPLIAMKLITTRPRDRNDVMMLIDAGVSAQEVERYLKVMGLNVALHRFKKLTENI